MQILYECRCPDCKVLLGRVNGIAEFCCRGTKKKHDKKVYTFEDGKLIKKERL